MRHLQSDSSKRGKHEQRPEKAAWWLTLLVCLATVSMLAVSTMWLVSGSVDRRWGTAAFLLATLTLLLLLMLPGFFRRRGKEGKASVYALLALLLVMLLLIVRLGNFGITVFAFKRYIGLSAALGLAAWIAVLRYIPKLRKRNENESKIHRGLVWFGLLIVALLFASGVVMEINLAGGYSPPTSRHLLTVEDKHTVFHSQGPDDCMLDFRVNGQSLSIQVSRSFYERVEPGDCVEVCFYEGLLKIPYALVTETEP